MGHQRLGFKCSCSANLQWDHGQAQFHFLFLFLFLVTSTYQILLHNRFFFLILPLWVLWFDAASWRCGKRPETENDVYTYRFIDFDKYYERKAHGSQMGKHLV